MSLSKIRREVIQEVMEPYNQQIIIWANMWWNEKSLTFDDLVIAFRGIATQFIENKWPTLSEDFITEKQKSHPNTDTKKTIIDYVLLELLADFQYYLDYCLNENTKDKENEVV